MNTNIRKTIGQITLAVLVGFALAALAPHAHAQGGIPLWTNIYNGPATNSDHAHAIATDASGNVIVTGYSVGIGTSCDYATVKYSSAGIPLWTNRYDGPGHFCDVPEPEDVAVDASGNVFVTGFSDGNLIGAYATIKYSSTGAPLWTNRFNAYDRPTAMAVDLYGNVFVMGTATIKYSSAGTLLWAKTYTNGAPTGIAVDSTGNVFVVGPEQVVPGMGSFDYTTIKYSSTGVPLWTNRYNGPSDRDDYSDGIAVDSNGDVVVTGASHNGTNFDYATIKYSNAGVPLWTNRYDGAESGDDHGRLVAVDSRGNVFVTGSSAGFFSTVAYSSMGVPLWTNRFNNYGAAIAVDKNGTVFVTSGLATVAYSNAGLPLWTNFTANAKIFVYALAVDTNGNVFVAGNRCSGDCTSGDDDYVTIKYSPTIPPIHLAIERDGSGGFFIRYTGAPDVTYRLQRAASVTGAWSDIATNTAPTSGLIEYHDTAPLPGQGFYRAVQP